MLSVRVRLCIMMVLQYMVWGAWLPTLGRYLLASTEEGGLGFNMGQVGFIIGVAGSVGAITAPFIAGQLADRYFNQERFLAFLLVLGGIITWTLSMQTTYSAWLWLAIANSVVFMPTLSISNSIAFAHVDGKKEFNFIRVWGNPGWILGGWCFSWFWLQSDLSFQVMPPFLAGPEVENVTSVIAKSLVFSSVLSFIYAGYCFLLPKTPPKQEGVENMAVAKAFKLFSHPSFTILVIASLAISIIHNIYFISASDFLSKVGVSDSKIAPVMTIGQFAEIIVMTGLALMLRKIGFKWVIFIGAFAYFLRYSIWGTLGLPMEVVVTSQILHGFCYACFFAGAFIYVDRLASDDIKASAQAVFGIMILGGGPILAGILVAQLGNMFALEDGSGVNYGPYWYTCAGIGLATAILIAVAFRDETEADDAEEEAA
jgi:nucleoside transporter